MMIPTKPILGAAGGRRRRLIVDLPDPPLAPNGEPQGLQAAADSSGLSPAQSSGILLLFLLVVALVIAFLFNSICKKAEEEHRQQATSSHGGEGGRRPRQRPPQQRQAAAVPEVAVDMQQAEAEAALDCKYKASEPWEEGTCSVCLAELEDGEALKMLMPCMHYFHTACLDEWLRKSTTCPICRAPCTAAAAAAPKAAGRRRRT
ncbi:unnamed protein product [Urochloa decumbens]|uniref:RING-type domain-containing protein n=1 Tax=Urochloa decumbens TaxID=240449 RepID=A0ABC9H4C7_9POAL